jgi:hypothetical protein
MNAAADPAVEIVRDLVYGHGLVQRGRPGGSVLRELRLDLYLPAAPHSQAGFGRR